MVNSNFEKIFTTVIFFNTKHNELKVGKSVIWKVCSGCCIITINVFLKFFHHSARKNSKNVDFCLWGQTVHCPACFFSSLWYSKFDEKLWFSMFLFFIAVKRVKKILKSNYQLTKKENNIFSLCFSLSCTCVENIFFTPCRIIIQAETIIFLKYTILPFKSINIFSIWKLAHCHSYLVANSRIPKCI